MDNKLKIIFVGIPDMASVCLANLLEKKFNIVGVVPPKKNHETYPYFKNFVQSRGLNLIEFEKSANDKKCVEKIKKLNADIGVVCSYNNLLSKEFLSSTKMGYINSHPSLLPYYRGAMPYFHIINNDEKISGITLHFMDENFDTGDIVYQEKFNITPFETMGTIFNRTTYMISDALIKVLEKLEKTGSINRIPQKKDEKYIMAPKVEGNFRVNWKKSIFKIDCLIRACNPFFNVYAYFRGVNVKIIKAKPICMKHDFELGSIVEADENKLLIAAKDGCISIEVLQIGTWGVFNPCDFYYTFSPKIGEFIL